MPAEAKDALMLRIAQEGIIDGAASRLASARFGLVTLTTQEAELLIELARRAVKSAKES